MLAACDIASADEIPISLESTDLDADSSRLAGQDSAGTTYYLVRSNDDQAPCVVVVPAEGEWWSACGGLGMRGTGPDGTSVEIIDPALEVDRDMDAETVGDSLLVHPVS